MRWVKLSRPKTLAVGSYARAVRYTTGATHEVIPSGRVAKVFARDIIFATIGPYACVVSMLPNRTPKYFTHGLTVIPDTLL